MKCQGIRTLLFAAVAVAFDGVGSSKVAAPESPVKKVVLFLEELRSELTEDTAKESADYALYKAWCDETTADASANIVKATATVEECNRKIERLSGSGAASGANIEHQEQSLAENKERTKGAMGTREKELKEYTKTTDSLKEQIANLDAAQKQLQEGQKASDASGSNFLQKQDSHQARAVAAIRKLLEAPSPRDLAESDLKILSSFARSAGTRKNSQLMQMERDSEEPASALDGVLSVVDEVGQKFKDELTEAGTEEAERAKIFKGLMATLTKERSALETSLTELKANKGSDAYDLAETNTLRDETDAQLKADQKLLTSTQDSCKEKTYQFKQRSSMRADELKGVNLTLDILTKNSSSAAFSGAAAVSFTQLARVKSSLASSESGVRNQAYGVLKAVASKYGDLKLAQIAVKVKSGGAFDRVIKTIDAQIKNLRTEEKEDLVHRDRCQHEIRDNTAALATLSDTIDKTKTIIDRLTSKKTETQFEISELRKEISGTKTDVANLTREREEERAAFLTAVKHDKEALVLMKSAIKQVTEFYKKSKISLNFAQEKQVSLLVQARGYKPAPDAGFKDANYQGGKDSTKAVVAMMEMVKEDMEKEVENGQQEDAENQKLYEKDYGVLNALLETQKMKDISLSKALAEVEGEIQSKEDTKSTKTDERSSEVEQKDNLAVDCGWIKTNFGERRKKRKAEIDGLVEAKGLLAGA